MLHVVFVSITMHVSNHRYVLGWHALDSIIQHCTLVAMYKQHKCDHCLQLDPLIQFGIQSCITLELLTALEIFSIIYAL